MRLVNIDLGLNILFEENIIYELIIENPKVMAESLSMLSQQLKGEDGAFVLSENNKILKIEKTAEMIIDFFGFTINDRKIIARLYSVMNDLAKEMFIEQGEINQKIVNALDRITMNLGYGDVQYDLDLKWENLFKCYDVKLPERYDNLIEKLTEYIKALTAFTDVKVLILVNVRDYLTQEEMGFLYKAVNYNKMSLLMVESKESLAYSGEKRYIVDKDRCLIEL